MWGEAAAQLGGSLIGGITTAVGQHQANIENRKEAERNRQFQERMSSTAHQRATADLRKAGLNPILSANSAASTPAGSTYTSSNALEGIGTGVKDAARLSFDRTKQAADIQLMGLQGKNVEAQTANAQSSAALNKAQTYKAAMETRVMAKDLPKSDLLNRGAKLLEPFVKKLEESQNTSAQSPFNQRLSTADDAAAILRHKRAMRQRQQQQKSLERDSESVFLP